MAYRQWLPNPAETVGVRLTDDAMHPILPAGSIVAIDRSVARPPAAPGADRRGLSRAAMPMIRWLDLSGRHLILRPEPAEPRASADPGRDQRHRPMT